MGWAGYKVDIIYIFHILDLKKDLKYKWLDVKFLLTLGVGIWIFEVFILLFPSSALHMLTHLFLITHEVGKVIILILQMRKLKWKTRYCH